MLGVIFLVWGIKSISKVNSLLLNSIAQFKLKIVNTERNITCKLIKLFCRTN